MYTAEVVAPEGRFFPHAKYRSRQKHSPAQGLQGQRLTLGGKRLVLNLSSKKKDPFKQENKLISLFTISLERSLSYDSGWLQERQSPRDGQESALQLVQRFATILFCSHLSGKP